MPRISHHQTPAQKRKLRVRRALQGTALRPRVSVYRSNKHIFVQAIDDVSQKTIVSAHDTMLTAKTKQTKIEKAVATAQLIAELLEKNKIKAVIFDRGSYRYHGRVKAVAEALREAGITL
ncbi:MAG: 50S ribosomal protein L18 [Microgenomates group bacterium]